MRLSSDIGARALALTLAAAVPPCAGATLDATLFFHDGTQLTLEAKPMAADSAAFALRNQSGRAEQFDEIRVLASTTGAERQQAEYANMTSSSYVDLEALHDPGAQLVVG